MVRNVIHLGLGQVATTVLTILLNATLARTLSASDFGLLYLASSIATFAYVTIDWGHGPIIVREAAGTRRGRESCWGALWRPRTAFALVACVVAFAITWLLGYDTNTRILGSIMILVLLPQYLGLSFGWVFRGRERMDQDAILNVALKLATLIGSVACLALGGRLLAVTLTWALAGCSTLAIGLVIYRRMQLPRSLQPWRRRAKCCMRALPCSRWRWPSLSSPLSTPTSCIRRLLPQSWVGSAPRGRLPAR